MQTTNPHIAQQSLDSSGLHTQESVVSIPVQHYWCICTSVHTESPEGKVNYTYTAPIAAACLESCYHSD